MKNPDIEFVLGNKPTDIHKDYCPNCPSRMAQIHGNPDPEAEWVKTLPDGERQKYAFPCGWRPEKLCKGVCEDLNYVEELHKDLLYQGDI